MWLRAGLFVLASCLLWTFTASGRAEGRERPRCLGEVATIVGTREHDDLEGTKGRDVIVGKGGRDEIFGRGGDDIICAGDGRRHRGEFSDSSDAVYGGLGDDRISGGKGYDHLNGGSGDDVIHGGPSNDYIWGDRGHDLLVGGVHRDELVDPCGTDVLLGGPGGDSLNAGDGDDRLVGSAGNDLLRGGDGDDRVMGGAGTDWVMFWFVQEKGCVSADNDGSSVRGVHVDLSRNFASSPKGRDVLSSIENVEIRSGRPRSANDRIIGDAGPNVLLGGVGDDLLIGRGGADSFPSTTTGGGGNWGQADEYRGGAGRDTIETQEGDHTIKAGPGRDHLIVDIWCDDLVIHLPEHHMFFSCEPNEVKLFGIEDVTVESSASTTITGTDGPNYLETGSGDDVISGGSGNDEIRAGHGNDDLDGGAGSDLGDGDEGIDKCQGFERDMRCEL